MAGDPVADLLARSNRLGSDPRNTNYAGGNASAKGTATDPATGEPAELLWVKGSGGDLGTLTAGGLAVLRLDRLRALTGVYPGPEREDEMVAAFDYCLHGRGGAAPSIDTAMHGLVGAAHVDHLHPDAGIALAAAADGEKLTAECFGGRVAWLPWRRPGFQLGLEIAEIQRGQPAAIGVILGGHGITAWGATSDECESRSLEIIATAQRFIDDTGRREPFGRVLPGFEALPERQRQARAAALAPVLRGLASTDRRQVGHFTDSPAVLDFLARAAHPRLVQLGTSCPDHFLRTKVRPLLLDLPAAAPLEAVTARLAELHEAYRAGYEAYYQQHATADSPPMRGADPAVVLVPGVGMFSFGADKQTARVAGEFYLNAINVMRGAEAVSQYAPISEAEKFRIEYWPLEEAKLARRPAPRPLAGRVALVTGGGSGIGRAIARRLSGEGACVVVADVDLAAAQETALELGSAAHPAAHPADIAVAVAADVTDEAAVLTAFDTAALAFGGVDLVVNNAGLSISKPLLDTTVADWDLQHAVHGPRLVPGLQAAAAQHDGAAPGRRHHLHLQQERRGCRAGQHRLRRSEGRPGAPGPAARGRARPPRHPGQRHQSGRGRPRIGHLRRRLGREAGRGVRRARVRTRSLLCRPHAAEAGGAAGARGCRRDRADHRRAQPDHRPARSRRRGCHRCLPALRSSSRPLTSERPGAGSWSGW